MNKREILMELEALQKIVDNQRGFKSKSAFLAWAAKVEPLLAFNPLYQTSFAEDLHMIHAPLSSVTAGPLADRMRTMLLQAIQQLKHEMEQSDGQRSARPSSSAKDYIHPDRLKELRRVNPDKFDLCKLLRLCEELNECYRAGCALSTIMLTRALIDHIPPVFGFNTFNEVTNNYAGTKSFKKSMERLNISSRNIANQHLHTPIRKSESIPTMNQADFSHDVDVLLGEVYRILKQPQRPGAPDVAEQRATPASQVLGAK
jgi:hypothetical protein